MNNLKGEDGTMFVSRTWRNGFAAGIGIAALINARPASAQLYMDVINPSVGGDAQFVMLGYSFTLDSTRAVNALGVFDVALNGQGFVQPFQIAIWNQTNPAVPLVQGNLPSFGPPPGIPVTSAAGNGIWRLTPVPLQWLTPGNTYVIALHFFGGDFFNFGTPVPFPGIHYGVDLFEESPTFVMPTRVGLNFGFFGPTFAFLGDAGAGAPEPASLALRTLGAIGFLARRRK